MRRALGLLIGLVLLVGGIVLGLYGLFAILYGGDGGGSGDTYVSFGGHEIDAGLAGAVSLLVAFLAIVFSIFFLKRERTCASTGSKTHN
jgi:ABC-type sugar transport system permease subunit